MVLERWAAPALRGVVIAIGVAFSTCVPARATEALWLTWDDCPFGISSTNMDFACNDNAGTEQLFLSFSIAQPASQVIGVEAVVDLQSTETPVPHWWQMGVGGCRKGGLSILGADADFSTFGACVNPWSVLPAALIQGFTVGAPDHGLDSQARIKATATVPSSAAATLAADTTYYALKIVIHNDLTAGPGSCVGCLAPLCLVLNSITVRREPGAPGGDIFVSTPGPGNGNWATWRSAPGSACAAVPIKSRTWGALKALYH
jgi:hypothetical protein